jgi:hypothetical protein
MKNKPGPKVKFLTLERIKERTTEQGDCHIWNGPFHRQSYPMCRFPQTKKMRTTYSVVWELLGNPVPGKGDKAKLTRSCGNIKCVNPDHIVLKNMSDVMKAARQGNGCMFSDDDIRQIRKDLEKEYIRDEDGNPVLNKNGKIKKTIGYHFKLAKKWGCGPQHMWTICNNYRYRWVKEEK